MIRSGPWLLALSLSQLSLACSREPTGPPTGQQAEKTLTLGAPVEHADEMPAREPMIVEHPNGTLFVTGYGAPTPHLWKSVDQGATWTAVNVGPPAQGAVGNSDVDLAIAPDGTLYFVVMSYDRQKYEGTQIATGSNPSPPNACELAVSRSWTEIPTHWASCALAT